MRRGYLAVCLPERMSRRGTSRVEGRTSTIVDEGRVECMVFSFSEASFVSDSKVKVVVKECGAIDLVKKRI